MRSSSETFPVLDYDLRPLDAPDQRAAPVGEPMDSRFETAPGRFDGLAVLDRHVNQRHLAAHDPTEGWAPHPRRNLMWVVFGIADRTANQLRPGASIIQSPDPPAPAATAGS
jgi:hypothetical protein